MSDIIPFLFPLLLVVLYTYLVFIQARKLVVRFKANEKGKAIRSAITFLLLVWLGLTVGVLPGSGMLKDLKFSIGNTGRAFLLGTPSMQYHSERGLNGDGYSISVYELSDRTAAYFESPDEEFFETSLSMSWRRSGWTPSKWRETPARPNPHYLNIRTLVTPRDAGYELSELFHEIWEQPGNYYAYRANLFEREEGTHIGDIDLYLISPDKKVFIKINSNT